MLSYNNDIQDNNINNNLDMLEYKEYYYIKARELGSLLAVEDLPVSEIPKKFHKFFNK